MDALEPVVKALLLGLRLPEEISAESITAARRHKLGPLLLTTAVAQGAELDPFSRTGLGFGDLRAQARSRQQHSVLSELRALAEEQGAELCIIKGAWNASALYDQPSFRPASDIDLYVGDWSRPSRKRIFTKLGFDSHRLDAVEKLAERGTPIHEVKIETPEGDANLDLHFNPMGFVEPTRTPVAEYLETRDLAEVGVVRGPVPELGLLIALSNLTRDRGINLISAADAIRFADGAAGRLDWDRFAELVSHDDLIYFAQQTLWALFDDVGWQGDCGIERPKNRARWCARLSDDTQTAASQTVLLRRGRYLRPRHVQSFIRWYLPNSTILSARDNSGGMTSSGRRMTHMRAWWNHRSGRLRGGGS